MTQQNSGREWHGMFRARVTEVDIEGNDYGAIRVFVPDLFASEVMTTGEPGFNEDKYGLIAYPANNPMGGYNTSDGESSSYYQASMYVPLKNSWVWVFFENGDPSRPYYMNAFNCRNSKVPPENRGVAEPHKVYTMCKTHSGRSLIICDSEDQARIELTGKRRILSGGPEGNAASVYSVDGNMTTVLLDERAGKEKLLIRTYKGDYIHIDIDERQLQMFFMGDMRMMTMGNVDVYIQGNLSTKVAGDIKTEVGGSQVTKNGGDHILQSDGITSLKSGGNTSIDSDARVLIQQPSAKEAPSVVPIPPFGFRGT